MRHQVCMGCHMRIPTGAVITLMHGTDIQLCDNCGRYLYLPADAHNKLAAVFEEARATGARSKPNTSRSPADCLKSLVLRAGK